MILPMAESRPNVLWISFEDTNPYYGCYGDAVARTPNLDRLAADGCRWTRCFSTAGVCAPARCAVITGMYAISVGAHHMRTSTTGRPGTAELPTPYETLLPHYVKCIPEYLRAAGYYCTNNAKTDYQFTPPFTAWDDCSSTAHWRNRPDPNQPFFSVFNPTRTHESGMWPENCPETLTVNPDDIELPPYFPDTPKVRTAMAQMYTHIERSDRELGELLQQIEEDGLADNTVVMHWSDHGPLPRGKRWPYDSGIRVPLVARWPEGIEPATVCEEMVSTVDLGPTILSLAGIPVPGHLQGRVFLGDQAAPPREFIFASRDRHDEMYDMVRAARDKRFKYIRHYHPERGYLGWNAYRNRHPIMQEWWRAYAAGELNEVQSIMFSSSRLPEELYDTETDPWEVNNLAGDPAYGPQLSVLRQAVDAWIDEVGDLGMISEQEMVRRWYPDGTQPQTATPVVVPIHGGNPGLEPAGEESECRSPALVQLHCATQGASIGYTFESGDSPTWTLYTGALPVPAGRTQVRAKAIRVGYLESDEASALIHSPSRRP